MTAAVKHMARKKPGAAVTAVPQPRNSQLRERFPARPAQGWWPATAQSEEDTLRRLTSPPFLPQVKATRAGRRRGTARLLRWLASFPGDTWQQRWKTSGAEDRPGSSWVQLPLGWLRDNGLPASYDANDLSSGLLMLICGDVIRPGMAWMVTRAHKHLAPVMEAVRDPAGFARLRALAESGPPASLKDARLAATRIATVLACKGGVISDITVGDCVEMADTQRLVHSRGGQKKVDFYLRLHALGIFPADAPATIRAFGMAQGQLTIGELVDRYLLQCTPVRDLIVDYLRERQPALDYASLDAVFFLGSPDFIVGPDAPRHKRNILGVIDTVGLEIGKEVIGVRKQLRDLVAAVAGKAIHPVFGLPGGVSRSLSSELQQQAAAAAARAIEFSQFALGAFRKTVLGNPGYVEFITSEAYTHRTYYMGLVDDANKVTFYDGTLRVVGPDGKELLTFTGKDYLDHVAEHVEPWTYMKFCFLKDIGWHGFADGAASGVYSVAPLARLNVADGMATPRAQEAYEEFVTTLGPKPVHHTLANHWARIIELVYAAERMAELAADPQLTDPRVRTLPTAVPREGVGVVEAPRGTLFHHYRTDERGLITAANLIVATQNNAARIALSVDKAARALIRNGQVDDGLLNQVEMSFRAYDPCFGCSTHSLPGQMALIVEVRDAGGALVQEIRRD